MAKADDPSEGLSIISPVFRNGSAIPPQYTCKGQNVNPPLNFFNAPAGSQSLVLIMHDPDAPGTDYLHWLVWDIPPGTEHVAVNSVPVGAMQGLNDAGKAGYSGPCPPAGSGAHGYHFDLYALDTTLDLPPSSAHQDIKAAMNGHVLERTRLLGTFSTS